MSWFNLPKKFPLRWVIIVPMSLQIATVVGLVGWLSWRSGQKTVTELANQLSTQVSNQIEQQVHHYFDTTELVLQLNATHVQTGRLDLQDFAQLERYFWEQTKITDIVTTIYYGSKTGDFLQVERGDISTVSVRTQDTAPYWEIYRLNAQGDRTRKLHKNRYDPRVRPWYRLALNQGKLVWSAIYVFAEPPVLGITPAIPIYEDSGEIQGVMAIDLPLSQISAFLQDLPINQSGETFIMERSGKLVATSTDELLFVTTPEGREPQQARKIENLAIRSSIEHLYQEKGNLRALGQDQAVVTDEQGRRYFLQVTPLKNDQDLDWLLGVVIPEQYFQSAINTNRRTTGVICAIALVISASLGLLTSRWIGQPILNLANASRAITRGYLEQHIPITHILELDILGRSFNKMAIKVREAIDTLEKNHITLERLVEERTQALQVSEQKFAKAFRSSPDPIAITRLKDGRFLEVNKSFTEVTQYQLGQVLGKTARELNFWTHIDQWEEIIKQLRSQGRILNEEVTFRIATGESRIVRLSAELIEVDGNDCVLWVANDITKRKRAEAALREKEQYLRLILDNIPQQVFWKDTSCVFLGCNQNWAKSAYLNSPEDVIGKTDFELLDNPQIAQLFQSEDLRVMREDQPLLHKTAKKIRPGEHGEVIWLDINKIPLHDNDGNVIGLIGVIDDITERKKATEALKQEQKKSEALLLNILPKSIVKQLKEKQISEKLEQNSPISPKPQKSLIAQQHEETTILFADIVGFTPLSTKLSPIELIDLLNDIFSTFDQLADQYQLEKIKTIGDAYMVAGGLPIPRSDHADAIAQMALDMQNIIRKYYIHPNNLCQIRIGIHTGSVIAGVIGMKKFIYDLWGDTVNVASRMESTGEPNKIQVTQELYHLLKKQYIFEERGLIPVKGKGEMFTYWLMGRKQE